MKIHAHAGYLDNVIMQGRNHYYKKRIKTAIGFNNIVQAVYCNFFFQLQPKTQKRLGLLSVSVCTFQCLHFNTYLNQFLFSYFSYLIF